MINSSTAQVDDLVVKALDAAKSIKALVKVYD